MSIVNLNTNGMEFSLEYVINAHNMQIIREGIANNIKIPNISKNENEYKEPGELFGTYSRFKFKDTYELKTEKFKTTIQLFGNTTAYEIFKTISDSTAEVWKTNPVEGEIASCKNAGTIELRIKGYSKNKITNKNMYNIIGIDKDLMKILDIRKIDIISGN
jgi:hypothetical protein